MARRIAIIFGGQSPEHEISVLSARNVVDALDDNLWTAIPLAVATDGQWLTETHSASVLSSHKKTVENNGVSLNGVPLIESGLDILKNCTAAFPLIHGKTGEDGTLQGLLEMANIAYAGSGVSASILGMDKSLSKAIWQAAGLPIARMIVLKKESIPGSESAISTRISNEIGYPCYVKPSRGGSSIGISKVQSEKQLHQAIALASQWDNKILIEEFIDGQEIECAIIGNGNPKAASCLGEVSSLNNFYDYDSKYSPNSTTQIYIPARISENIAGKLRDLAVNAYTSIGCKGFARVDFFVNKQEQIVLSEINTIPGFTKTSLFPRLWEASGLSYSAMLTQILELALRRKERE